MLKNLLEKIFPPNYEVYNLKIDWTAGKRREELMEIIKQYPNTYLGNQSEDFNGQTIYIGAKGIVFATKENMNHFLKNYGSNYNAKRTNMNMSLNVESF